MALEGLSLAISNYVKEKSEAKNRALDVAEWITDAAQRAKQIRLVTHAVKYSNSDAQGSSILDFIDESKSSSLRNLGILCSATVDNLPLDVVGNAAALDVGKFLLLEFGGKHLYDYIKEGDTSPLEVFAKSKEQLSDWMIGFNSVFSSNFFCSHTLSKQIYFPIGNDAYHLLQPLFATSLSHLLKRKYDANFSDEAKALREFKKSQKYSQGVIVDFPNIAIAKFGGDRPQNISLFNSQRGGRAILFSSGPPSWASVLKPPVSTNTIFSRNYFERRSVRSLNELSRFIVQVSERPSNLAIRNERSLLVSQVVEDLLQYVSEIQSISNYSGWSGTDNCILNRSEQLWLDPGRKAFDASFQVERERGIWKDDVSRRFALWLNRALNRRTKLVFGDAEYSEWKNILSSELDLFDE